MGVAHDPAMNYSWGLRRRLIHSLLNPNTPTIDWERSLPVSKFHLNLNPFITQTNLCTSLSLSRSLSNRFWVGQALDWANGQLPTISAVDGGHAGLFVERQVLSLVSFLRMIAISTLQSSHSSWALISRVSILVLIFPLRRFAARRVSLDIFEVIIHIRFYLYRCQTIRHLIIINRHE